MANHLPYSPVRVLERAAKDRETLAPGQLRRDVARHETAGLMILANALSQLQGHAPGHVPPAFVPSVAAAIREGLIRDSDERTYRK